MLAIIYRQGFSMQGFIRVLWDICLLRKSPQDLPFSQQCLFLVIFVNLAISTGQLVSQIPIGQALGQSAYMLGISIAFTWFVLMFKGFRTRFVQTCTALIGTSTIFAIIILPLLLSQLYFFNMDDPSSNVLLLNLLFFAFIFAVNIWAIVVLSHIFRHALQIPFFFGLLITLAYIALHILGFRMWMQQI